MLINFLDIAFGESTPSLLPTFLLDFWVLFVFFLNSDLFFLVFSVCILKLIVLVDI